MLAPRIADHVAAFTKLYADKHLEFMIGLEKQGVLFASGPLTAHPPG